MQKERQPLLLQELRRRKSRIEHIVSQREALYDAIGSGRITPSTFEGAIKVGRTKERVVSSIKRLRTTLSGINEQITSRHDELISIAQAYQDETALRREQVREIKHYVDQGHLPREVYERCLREFRSLQRKPGHDPELKRGLKLLAEEKEEQAVSIDQVQVAKKETAEVAPKMMVDLETQEVRINGRNIKIHSHIIWEVFLSLTRHAKINISWRELAKIAKENGSKSKIPARDVVQRLRKIVEVDPKNPQFIIREGSGQKSRYRFNAEVEFIGEDPKVKRYQEAHQESKVTLPDGQVIKIKGRLAALALDRLLQASKDNPVSIIELTETLYGLYSSTRRKAAVTVVSRLKKELSPFN